MKKNRFKYSDVSHQRTLKRWVSICGVGLHSGREVEMRIGPAVADSGVTFQRSDLPQMPCVRARTQNIHSSMLCTVLREKAVQVSTVEHLLAAFYGLGVDNAQVVLNSEEAPILDGSAQPLVDLLHEAGIVPLAAPRSCLQVVRPVVVSDGDRSIEVSPARRLSIDCCLDFDHPLVNNLQLKYEQNSDAFEGEVAPARTFGFLKDVGMMKRAGLVKGGSLKNAVVIDDFSVLNPTGLRYNDEFVRHKLLDILGDLALLGSPLVGHVRAYKSGHTLHHELVKQLATQPDCCVQVQLAGDCRESDLPFDLAPFQLPELQSA